MGVEERQRDIENIKKVYNVISNSPGIDKRDLQAQSRLKRDEFYRCVNRLKEHDAITEEGDGGYLRVFTTEGLSDKEKKILMLLRQFIIRNIIIYLLEHPNSKPVDVAREVHISNTNLSWHLKKLSDIGLISTTKSGWNSHLNISNSDLVMKLLITYKESFLDKLVNKFVETWIKK